MTILKIAQLGHPVLRQIASPVSRSSIMAHPFQSLIDDLVDTMRDYDGVGIAAIQVLRPERVFVIEVRGPTRYRAVEPFSMLVVINPVLEPLDDVHISGWEGCLSVGNLRGIVPRHRSVLVRGMDRAAEPVEIELGGFPAVVAQHEVDHLNGAVFLDRVEDTRSLAFFSEYERYHLESAPGP